MFLEQASQDYVELRFHLIHLDARHTLRAPIGREMCAVRICVNAFVYFDILIRSVQQRNSLQYACDLQLLLPNVDIGEQNI